MVKTLVAYRRVVSRTYSVLTEDDTKDLGTIGLNLFIPGQVHVLEDVEESALRVDKSTHRRGRSDARCDAPERIFQVHWHFQALITVFDLLGEPPVASWQLVDCNKRIKGTFSWLQSFL